MKKILGIAFMCFMAAACSTSKSDDSAYSDDMRRFRENIAVKAQSADFVTYEYKDVRVDELAPLAILYCRENANGKQAYLREVIMYRNRLRRATFDCLNLAKQE